MHQFEDQSPEEKSCSAASLPTSAISAGIDPVRFPPATLMEGSATTSQSMSRPPERPHCRRTSSSGAAPGASTAACRRTSLAWCQLGHLLCQPGPGVRDSDPPAASRCGVEGMQEIQGQEPALRGPPPRCWKTGRDSVERVLHSIAMTVPTKTHNAAERPEPTACMRPARRGCQACRQSSPAVDRRSELPALRTVSVQGCLPESERGRHSKRGFHHALSQKFFQRCRFVQLRVRASPRYEARLRNREARQSPDDRIPQGSPLQLVQDSECARQPTEVLPKGEYLGLMVPAAARPAGRAASSRAVFCGSTNG